MRVTSSARISLIAVTVITLSACHKTAPAPEFKKVGTDTVYLGDTSRIKTATLETKSFPITVDFPGRITIPDSDIFVLSARVQGRLETVPVTTGDSVTKGQVVANIWSPDLSVAAEELVVAKQFGDKSLISSTQQKLAALGVDPQDIKGKQGVFPFRSPIEGAVLERKLSSGNAVQPGDVIMTIGKLGVLQFQGEIPPDVAVKIEKGMKVLFDDYPGITASVSNISPVADPNSRLVRVRATFDAKLPTTLPQESFLKGKIVTQEVDALVAPAKSLVFTNKGEFIFVQTDKANEYRRVKVDVQNRNKTDIAIAPSDEIKPGMHVISDGVLLLNDLLQENG